MAKRGLGKGLNALIPNKSELSGEAGGISEIDISRIQRNKKQPRHEFDPDKLEELAASIREHGVIQPIIVRRTDDDQYEIVAGERRWRAARMAGLKKIPAVVKDVTEREFTEIALIENIQREDLNPIEEANAFKQLIDEFGLTQEELSKRVGKSRPFITNSMRLLNLPREAQEMVQKGQLTAGHARALLVLERSADQASLAKRVIERHLSVRQIEQLVKKLATEDQGKEKKTNGRQEDNFVMKDIEEKVQEKLGTKVRIKHGPQKGLIEIEYYGDADFERIIEALLGDKYS